MDLLKHQSSDCLVLLPYMSAMGLSHDTTDLSLQLLLPQEQPALPAPSHFSYKFSFAFKLPEIRTNTNLGRAIQKIQV